MFRAKVIPLRDGVEAVQQRELTARGGARTMPSEEESSQAEARAAARLRATLPASYLVVGDEDWRLLVLPSAGRHDVEPDDALHAIAHYVDLWQVGEGMTMLVGPSRTGAILEVGVVPFYGDIAVAHAMPVRPKFVRR